MTMPDRPSDHEIDAYGLTHPGNVRKVNEDQFFIGALVRQVRVEYTSLPPETLLVEPDRLGSLAIVADGVGSGGGGAEASKETVRTISEYVARSMAVVAQTDGDDPEEFTHLLQDAALQCHTELLERSKNDPEKKTYGTTLTLWLGLWPQAYLLQVGDSRCYLYRDGTLTQLTRDQTMAQDLVDQGVLSRSTAMNTRWAHVLSSAIGGAEAAPTVTRITRDWGSVVLLCSDGLTKHVSDERIAERLGSLTSAKQACEALLQDALDGGGSDNVTIIVGRTERR